MQTAFVAVQKIDEVRVTFDNHACDDFKKRSDHVWGLCDRKREQHCQRKSHVKNIWVC